MACERGTALIFLFVADPGFTKPVDELLAAALADELKRLGNQLLCIAQSRARERKVDADIVVRQGPMRQTIEDYLREVDASVLILGTPHTHLGMQAFAPGELPRFAEEIRAANGVEVFVVE